MLAGIVLTLQGAELLGWTALWRKSKSDANHRIVTQGFKTTQRIPVVDGMLKRMAGQPNNFEKGLSSRLTKLVRAIANTTALEHLIAGLVNARSPIRKRLQQSNTMRVL